MTINIKFGEDDNFTTDFAESSAETDVDFGSFNSAGTDEDKVKKIVIATLTSNTYIFDGGGPDG